MPTFIVTNPSGKEFEVDAPEGSTRRDALSYLRRKLSVSPPPTAPSAESDVPQVGQGQSVPYYRVPLLDRAAMGPDSRPIEDRLAGLKQTHPEAWITPGDNGEPTIVVWDKANRKWVSANPPGFDSGDVAAYGRIGAEGLGGGLGALAGAFGAAPTGMMAAPVSVPLGTGLGATAAGQLYDSALEWLGGRKDSRGLLQRAADTATEVPLQTLGAKAGDAISNFVRGKGKDYLQTVLGVVKQTVDPTSGMIAQLTKGRIPGATILHDMNASIDPNAPEVLKPSWDPKYPGPLVDTSNRGIPVAGALGAVGGAIPRGFVTGLRNLPLTADSSRAMIRDTLDALKQRTQDFAGTYGRPSESLGAWSGDARVGLSNKFADWGDQLKAQNTQVIQNLGPDTLIPVTRTQSLLDNLETRYAKNPTSNYAVNPVRGHIAEFLANEQSAASAIPGVSPDSMQRVQQIAASPWIKGEAARRQAVIKDLGFTPDQADQVLRAVSGASGASTPGMARLGEVENMRVKFREGYPVTPASGYTNSQGNVAKQAYGATRNDIMDYAKANNPQEYANLVQQKASAERKATEVKALGPAMFEDPNALGNAVAKAINHKTGNADLLDKIERNLPEQDWQNLKATTVHNLGRADPGQQNEAGTEFSAAKLMTNYNKMSQYAKEKLFGVPGDPSYVNNMSRIARISEAMAKSGKEMNTSYTAPVTMWMRILQGSAIAGGLGGGHATGNPWMYSLGIGAASPVLAEKLFMNPTFVRFLVSTPAKTQAGLASQVMRLGASLAAKQDTPPEVMEGYEAMKNKLLGSPKAFTP